MHHHGVVLVVLGYRVCVLVIFHLLDAVRGLG